MTSLTERYLAAALRGIREAQRTDVERELRSSIADALEDRVTAGENSADAEKAVLEGLGDLVRLAAGIAGRPLYLIGPDLFVEYPQLLFMLLSIVLPIVGIVQVGVAISGGYDIIGALVAGVGGAWTVGLHIFFWVTITFALVEPLDAAREAKEEITGAAAKWTVDRLPALPPGRVTAPETVSEVLTDGCSEGTARPTPLVRPNRVGRPSRDLPPHAGSLRPVGCEAGPVGDDAPPHYRSPLRHDANRDPRLLRGWADLSSPWP